MTRPSRRRYLKGITAGTIVGLAGCTGSSDDSPGTEADTETTTRAETSNQTGDDGGDGGGVEEWPSYRYDPGNTGSTPASGPSDEPSEAWRIDAYTPSEEDSMVFAHDHCYLIDWLNNLIAVDVSDRTVSWHREPANDSTTPAVGSDFLYHVGAAGTLVARDPLTGEQRWRTDSGLSTIGSPAVADSTVYVGGVDLESSTEAVVAVEAGDGTVRWRATVDEEVTAENVIYDQVAVADGIAYWPWHLRPNRRTTTLHALGEGEEVWKTELRGQVRDGPAVANGTVYVLTDSAAYALDAMTGETNWKTEIFPGTHPELIVGTEIVFVSGKFQLTALRADDGSLTRLREQGENEHFLDAYVKGAEWLYAKNIDPSYVAALDPTSGEERWRVPFDRAVVQIIPSDDALFVATAGSDEQDAQIVALTA